jgi:tetratricopeptide (TPR) repeat protein
MMKSSDKAILGDTPEAIAAYINVIGEKGHYERAEEVLRQALVTYPDESYLWNRLAVAQSELGKIDEAIESLTKAIELGHEESRITRGVCLETVGRFAEAEDDYRSVLERSPDNVDALVNLGTMQLSAGDNQSALDALTRAATLDPLANWQLSDALEAVGDAQGAIAAARAAIDAGEPRAYLELAERLADQAPRDEVISYFEQAIQAGSEWALRELVIFLDTNGLSAEAMRRAQAGADAGDTLCYAPLAVMLEANGDLEKAAYYYRLAIAEGDTNYAPDLAAIERELGIG